MIARNRFPNTLIASLIAVTALALVYARVGLLPGRLKTIALQKAEAITRKKIFFDKALYVPFRGLTFTDVKIRDRDGTALFVTKRLAIDVRLIPFLREKKIIIRNLLLDGPVFDCFTRPGPNDPTKNPPVKTSLSGQIDVPVVPSRDRVDLSRALESGPDILLPENVYLEQIQIADGLINISKDADSPLIEQIRNLNVKMAFRKPPDVLFSGSLSLGSDDYGRIQLDGRWNLDTANYEFFLHTRIERIPGWLQDAQKKNFLVLNEGFILSDIRLRSITETKILFHAKTDVRRAQAVLGSGNLAGGASLDLKGVYDFDDRCLERYRGRLDLHRICVDGFSDKIKRLDRLEGRIDFVPDFLKAQNFSGFYDGLRFEAEGTLKSFSYPLVEGRVQTRLDLSRLEGFLPEKYRPYLKDYDLRGGCKAITTFRGPLRNPKAIATEYRLRLEDVSLRSHDGKINVASFWADLTAGPRGISVENSRFRWIGPNAGPGQWIRLNLFVPALANQPGKLSLKTGPWNLGADYTLKNNGEALISRGRVRSDMIDASARGLVRFSPRPDLDLQGDCRARLDRLARTCGLAGTDTFLLDGILEGPYLLKGPADRPDRWKLSFDGASESILIKNRFRLNNFQIQIRYLDGLLGIPYLRGDAYGGVVGGKARLRLNGPNLPFESELYGHRLNVRTLAGNLTDERQANLSGTGSFNLTLAGQLKTPQTLHGNGRLSLGGGVLGYTDQFRQMGQLPFVKVEGMERVTLREIQGSFEVRDKKVYSEDLSIRGDTVGLQLKGSVGFDEELDFLMAIRYSGDIIRGAQEAGGLAPFMVREAENNIPLYRIRGKLRNPRFEKTTLPQTNFFNKP